jgi:hypothetical protein
MARDYSDTQQGLYALSTCLSARDELFQKIEHYKDSDSRFDMGRYRESLRDAKIPELKISHHRSECTAEDAMQIFAGANSYLKETLGLPLEEIDSTTVRIIEPQTNTEIIFSLTKTHTMITAWAFLLRMENYFDCAELAKELNRRLLIGHSEALSEGLAISTYRFLAPTTSESELKSILDGIFDAKHKLSELLS